MAATPAVTILLVLVAGLLSQWLAWALRLPAIVILIVAGLLLGPASGVLQFSGADPGLEALIGLGVAVILFEGGMNLELREFRRVGRQVRHLVLLGPPVAMVLGALAARYAGGLEWPVAWVLGAILVVTGPTVIQPLLRVARLNADSGALLKWEGIVNDPVGVLLAVLTFQYFAHPDSGGSVGALVLNLGTTIVIAGGLGGLSGWLLGQLYRRGGAPEYLKPPLLLVLVLIVYYIANQIQHESGLLAVTVMGLVLGNMRLGGVEELRRFKENLSVVLISALFIVLTARLAPAELAALDWRALATVLAFLLLVRPLAIFVSTLGSGMKGADRALLGWIAPRGIVAAATAGVLGPELVHAGYADAALLQPLVFAVILVTVLLHGVTIAPLGRRLALAAEQAGGLLIVGATPWTTALAQALHRAEVDVVLVDGVWRRLKQARLAEVPVYFGEILSEHAESWVETHRLDALLCATSNDFYNALVCRAMAPEFGQHRVFQLPVKEASRNHERHLLREQRGEFALKPECDYDKLDALLSDGWIFQTTRITGEHGVEQIEQARGEQWLPVALLSDSGAVTLYSEDLPFNPGPGQRLLYFAPGESSSS